MDLYNENYLNELSRNLHKRASYQNIFEIKEILKNFKEKFNLDLSRNNPIIHPYTNKKLNIYSINNNLNNIILNNNKRTYNINQARIFRSKRISSSYFEKIKNLYIVQTPNLFSSKIQKVNIKRKNNNINNKKLFNNNNYFPQISNNRKDLIHHIMNKNLNLISLENMNSCSLINKKEVSHKIKLPRINSTIIRDNKYLNQKSIDIRNKNFIRCNSSINGSNKPNTRVKNIYMSFGLFPKKKLNDFNKIVFLKHNYKKIINKEDNKNNINENGSKKLKYYLIDDFNLINKNKYIKKDKGKEYKFNKNFKKVVNFSLNSENNNMLLSDKGTLIGSFFN